MRSLFLLMVLSLSSLSGLAQESVKNLRLGLIGLDTSHVIAFTSRFNEPDNPNHVPGATVIAAFKGGSPDIPSSIDRVPGYTKTLTEKYGVKIYNDIAKMCNDIDAVLLTSLDGRPHLEQVKPVIAAGKPVWPRFPASAVPPCAGIPAS